MGVPIDDSELNDPGSDIDAPDPLIGESAQSGAIGRAVPSLSTARKNATDRYSENQSEMDDLRSQYAATSKAQSDAYSSQKAQIDAATKRLIDMQVGPSDQEAMYRAAAAISSPAGGRGFNVSGMNQTQADILKERREAELQKQQLIAQYAMQGPQATIGATNARLNQLTQQQRIVAGQLNSAGGQQFRGQANLPWYVKQNDDGSASLQPGAEKIMDQQAMSKLFGRFTLIPQPDGSKKIQMLGPLVPQSGGQPPAGGGSAPVVSPASQPTTQAPRPPAAPNAPAAPSVPGAPASQPAVRSPYDDVFQPSTVLDPKYGALTPQTKPAYVATAQQAFDPNYFSEYQWHPTVIGDDKIRVKQIEKMSQDQADSAQGAEATIFNYGHALQQMDQSQDLLSGPAGQKVGAIENTLRGILGDSLTGTITNDKDLAKLATQQDTDKYFLNAATSGLKAIYGGRITNMEVQQRLKSLPSNNLLPAVTKMLAAAQAEVAQDSVNRSKLWSVYKAKNGDPDPARFNTWYEANFSPFHDSRLKANLAAQQAATAAKAAAPNVPVTQNPLVAYYTGLAKWKASGSQGPAPQRPQ